MVRVCVAVPRAMGGAERGRERRRIIARRGNGDLIALTPVSAVDEPRESGVWERGRRRGDERPERTRQLAVAETGQ